MIELDRRYPGYGLAHNKGYGTADHLFSLKQQGPSPIHRRSFGPVEHWAQLSLDDLLRMVGGLDNGRA
jgi:ribonuclease HII